MSFPNGYDPSAGYPPQPGPQQQQQQQQAFHAGGPGGGGGGGGAGPAGHLAPYQQQMPMQHAQLQQQQQQQQQLQAQHIHQQQQHQQQLQQQQRQRQQQQHQQQQRSMYGHPGGHPQGPGAAAAQQQQQQLQHQLQYGQAPGGMGGMTEGLDGSPMGAGPGMMHAGMQHQMGVHHSPYTSGPYNQPVHTPSPSSLPPQHPAYRAPIPPPDPRQDSPLTPQGGGPPPRPRHVSGAQAPQQPQQAPPAAAITPPTKPTAGGPASSKPVVQPPLSPMAKEREKERISLLLVINGELLQEVVKLQNEGKAGVPSASPNQPGGAPTKEEGRDEKDSVGLDVDAAKGKKTAPHPDFIECMRRLQANLAYLAAIADRAHKPASQIPPSPAIMAAPDRLPKLAETYKKLLALFPNAPSPKSSKVPQPPSRVSPKGSGGAVLTPTGPGAPPLEPQQPTSAGLGGLGMGMAMNMGTGAAMPQMDGPLAEKNYKQWLEEMGGATAETDQMENEHKTWLAGQAQGLGQMPPQMLQQQQQQQQPRPGVGQWGMGMGMQMQPQ